MTELVHEHEVLDDAHATCNANDSEYLKYVADGRETLPDVVSALRDLADYYEKLRQGGATLDGPVHDGWLELDGPGIIHCDDGVDDEDEIEDDE